MESMKKISEDLVKLPKTGKHSVTESEFKKEIKALTTEFQLEFNKIEMFMKCMVDGITLILEKVNNIECELQSLKEYSENSKINRKTK